MQVIALLCIIFPLLFFSRYEMPQIVQQSCHHSGISFTGLFRQMRALGEQHDSVDSATFERLQQAQSFAMHWHANGRQYGVRHAELEPLKQHQWLLVNGSRAYRPEALRQFKGLSVLHISASADILRA